MRRAFRMLPCLLALGIGAAARAQQPAAVRVESVTPVVRTQPAASVLFADDFDRGDDLRERYFEYSDAQGSFVQDATGGLDGGGAMRCRFEKGQVTAGNLKVLVGRNPFGRGVRTDETFREIYWRVYVRHEPGWQGNPAKLARATSMAGRDWSQGLIAHVWGGKGDILCIDPATGIRDSRKVTARYNDFANLRWLGLRNGQTPIFSTSESGRWVCVESRVKVNSPGRQDGVFELWVDGRLEASRSDLDWHGEWNDYGINAVFLENYWNDGSVKRQARWFDAFVVGTAPIGPLATTETPVLRRTAGDVAAWEAEVAPLERSEDIAWRSRTLTGAGASVRVDTSGGTFFGSRSGAGRLAAGVQYVVRLRQREPQGAWSAWTLWHAPFTVAAR